jgi:hypothetical protein
MDERLSALQAALPRGWVLQRIERGDLGRYSVLVWCPRADRAELLGEIWGEGQTIDQALGDALEKVRGKGTRAVDLSF